MKIFENRRKEELDALTPREIVSRLDEYIVGQTDAKRSVAVAIRNRWRRRQLDDEMRKEVMPKNILMIGPTGVGKTEIARRLAGMVKAPFLKVEASKYTEVGYHGRDVESMIRDLAKVAVAQAQTEALEEVAEQAKEAAEERILDLLLPPPEFPADEEEAEKAEQRRTRTREKLLTQLHSGAFDDRMVEVSADAPHPAAGAIQVLGGEDMAIEMQDVLSKMMPGTRKDRKLTVSDAMRLFQHEEAEKLLDEEAVTKEGIERAEQNGLIFIDEIDKVIGSDRRDGPDISREGVQRDLLPIVEGCAVATKFGVINTDHILFIAAGAFHGKKPADMIPELQGRFPIRVELSALTKDDFTVILTHPRNALTKQYELLLGAEGVKLKFRKDSLEEMASVAAEVNQRTQDIGARRLHTIMEKIFEEISFDASEMKGETINVTGKMVKERLGDIVADEDLTRYVL